MSLVCCPSVFLGISAICPLSPTSQRSRPTKGGGTRGRPTELEVGLIWEVGGSFLEGLSGVLGAYPPHPPHPPFTSQDFNLQGSAGAPVPPRPAPRPLNPHTQLATLRSFHPLLTTLGHVLGESDRPIRGTYVISPRPTPQQWIS